MMHQLNRLWQRFRQWIQDNRRPVLALILWLLIAGIVQQRLQASGMSINDILTSAEALLTDHWYSPLIYIAIYTLRPLTLIPGTPFTLLGGFLYGALYGGIYALVGGLLSALLPYWFGRWFTNEETIQQHIEDDSFWWRIVALLRKHPFQATLTTRLLYLPYDTVNFIAGNLRIPFGAFIGATVIGNLVPAFAGAGIGSSVEGNLSEGTIRINPVVLAISLAIWLISLIASRLYKRWMTGKSQPLSNPNREGTSS